jgi:cellulose synthase/poly-beta-1,6-N-acetylglucosamine synthase-like glycosyltransferase
VQPLEPVMWSAEPPGVRRVDRPGAPRRSGRLSSPASVAVCIPARNEAATIGAIVSSMAGLVDSGSVEDLVVVDDGSTDGTAAIARRPETWPPAHIRRSVAKQVDRHRVPSSLNAVIGKVRRRLCHRPSQRGPRPVRQVLVQPSTYAVP